MGTVSKILSKIHDLLVTINTSPIVSLHDQSLVATWVSLMVGLSLLTAIYGVVAKSASAITEPR